MQAGQLLKDNWHRSVTTVARLYKLFPRRWGMRVTVYNDALNSGEYVLTYGLNSTSLKDNDNWLKAADIGQQWGGGGGSSTGAREYFTGDGSETEFTLSTPSNAQIQFVELGGQLMEIGEQVTINNITKTVTFDTAPDNGLTIGVYYFTQLSISDGVTWGSITGNIEDQEDLMELIPTSLSELTGDANNRTVTDDQITEWNASNAMAVSALRSFRIDNHFLVVNDSFECIAPEYIFKLDGVVVPLYMAGAGLGSALVNNDTIANSQGIAYINGNLSQKGGYTLTSEAWIQAYLGEDVRVTCGFVTAGIVQNFDPNADHVAFRIGDSYEIQCVARSNGNETVLGTGLTVALFTDGNLFTKLRLEIGSSNEALFYVDDVQVASISTNVMDFLNNDVYHAIEVRNIAGSNGGSLNIDRSILFVS